MEQFLSPKYFHHFLMLIRGSYLLLQDSISSDDLKEADKCMVFFTYFMDSLYGELIFIEKCAVFFLTIFLFNLHIFFPGSS